MICFINRSTVDYDVRLHKYVQACKETKNTLFCYRLGSFVKC